MSKTTRVVNKRDLTIFFNGDCINILRQGQPMPAKMFLIVTFMMLACITIGGLCISAYMLIDFMTTAKLLSLVVLIVFVIASLIGLFVSLWLQGLAFDYVVNFNKNFCKIKNGIIFAKFDLKNKDYTVVVFTTYSRGEWGVGANVKLTRPPFILPLIPALTVGGAMDTMSEIENIKTLLSKIDVKVFFKIHNDFNYN